MDPFKIGHRTSKEQDFLKQIILSRNNKSLPQSLVEGQFLSPPPLLFREGAVTADMKSFKQALAVIEVSADIQEFIAKAPARISTISTLMSKQPTPGSLSDCLAFKAEPNAPPPNASKPRKDLPLWFAVTLLATVMANSKTVDALLEESPTGGGDLVITDTQDPSVGPALAAHFSNYFVALARANSGLDPSSKVQFTQVIGVANRTTRISKNPSVWSYAQSVYLMDIEMTGQVLQNYAKRDGNPAEVVSAGYKVTPQRYDFSAKAFDGISGKYNDGLRSLAGKSLDEYGAALIRDVVVTFPPTLGG